MTFMHIAALCTKLCGHAGQRELLTFGSGMYGQLGHGDMSDRVAPAVVTTLPGLAILKTPLAVACGGWHTSIIIASGTASSSSTKGRLCTCGWGEAGQLGLGPNFVGRVHTPTIVDALDGVRKCS